MMEVRYRQTILKDNNFTKNKLNDRIKWLDGHTDEYLRILNEMDEHEDHDEIPEKLTMEVIEAKLRETRERQAKGCACQSIRLEQ